MSSNKFIAEATFRNYSHDHATHIKCNDCGAVTTFKHDTEEEAWEEHNKRGHSDETCAMMQRDKAREEYEMSKKDADFIDSYVNDYHNGNETLEFQ